MKTSLLVLALLTILAISDISMYNLKIGDAESSLEAIDLKVAAKDEDAGMTKYKTMNGNDFSVTTQNGKIVFMENDWLQDAKSTKPLFSNFVFGKTSLKDIRKTFGNNGFAYQNQMAIQLEKHVILFNCYEFDSPNNEVLAVITKVEVSDEITNENLAERAKLDAIIIADKDYLDTIWSGNKIYDPNYKKINP